MPNAQTHSEARNLDFFKFSLGCLNKASPNHGAVYILEVEPPEAAQKEGNKAPAHPPKISGTTPVKNMKIRL